MRSSTFVLALAIASASPVWAIYGTNTNTGSSDSTFTWVGQVNGASGVVIDPHWVLTAQHVGGSSFTLDGTTYNADATYDSPTTDLHLMHFADTFAGYYQLYSGSVIGQTVTLVGFGHSGSLRSDGLGYDDLGAGGTRRSATNVIGITQNLAFNGWNTPSLLADLDAPGGNNFSFPYNRDWFGDGGPTANEGGLMAGDSGGAWLIDVGGTYRLAGISNYVFHDSNQSGSDPNPDFAFGIGGSSAADLTNAVNRNWIVNTVPEPASMAAILVGLSGLAGLRRRKNR